MGLTLQIFELSQKTAFAFQAERQPERLCVIQHQRHGHSEAEIDGLVTLLRGSC